jgi:hypothetical protein
MNKEDLIKKITDRIDHLSNPKIHIKEFVRTAKKAEAEKILEWVRNMEKI